jgi:hypothetical protein
MSVDKGAAEALFESELERDATVAVHGYTDWLASSLYRKHRQLGRPLRDVEEVPVLSPLDISAIAQRYKVDGQIVELVVKELLSRRASLPFVGAIEGTRVLIDSAQLTRWADHYSWGSRG